MNHVLRMKRSQAILQQRGFWTPTVSFWSPDDKIAFTQKSWREEALDSLEVVGNSARATPTYKAAVRMQRLEKVAAEYGCDVYGLFKYHNDVFTKVSKRTEKAYVLRSELRRRPSCVTFTQPCHTCGGAGTVVEFSGHGYEPDVLEVCWSCGGEGTLLHSYTKSLESGTFSVLLDESPLNYKLTYRAYRFTLDMFGGDAPHWRAEVNLYSKPWLSEEDLALYITALKNTTPRRLKELVIEAYRLGYSEKEFIYSMI